MYVRYGIYMKLLNDFISAFRSPNGDLDDNIISLDFAVYRVDKTHGWLCDSVWKYFSYNDGSMILISNKYFSESEGLSKYGKSNDAFARSNACPWKRHASAPATARRRRGIFTRLSKLRDFTTRWAHFLTALPSHNFDTRFSPLARTFLTSARA